MEFDIFSNMDIQKKSGVVAIIGRPSAGKSTFLNSVCNQSVSIVSEIPQTTRNAIRGIYNDTRGQIVFIDTPGYHKSEKKLNLKLQQVAKSSLEGADAALYLMDSTRPAGIEENMTIELLAPLTDKTVIAINKIDLPTQEADSVRFFIANKFAKEPAEDGEKNQTSEIAFPPERILNISAKNKTGIKKVLEALFNLLPEGPELYPEEYYTDQEVDFRISEVIRGEAINRLQEEIPHAIYVEIADAEFKNEGKTLWVRAFLCVERESQKGIVIGKGASLIKEIRIASLKKLRRIFDYKIELDLRVKVDKNWRQRDKVLNKILS